MATRTTVAAAVLVGAALALAGCADPGGGGEVGAFAEGAGAHVEADPGEREPAPEVSGETLDGEPLDLADLDGPVLVNFWASWCGPCVQEAPVLQRAAERYGDEVAFLGVNVRDQQAAARSFERDFAKPYPSLHDPESSIAAAFGGVGPRALPTTLLLDGEHRVAVRLFGAVSDERLDAHLAWLLDDERGADPDRPDPGEAGPAEQLPGGGG